MVLLQPVVEGGPGFAVGARIFGPDVTHLVTHAGRLDAVHPDGGQFAGDCDQVRVTDEIADLRAECPLAWQGEEAWVGLSFELDVALDDDPGDHGRT